jgi:hypothetical protein
VSSTSVKNEITTVSEYDEVRGRGEAGTVFFFILHRFQAYGHCSSNEGLADDDTRGVAGLFAFFFSVGQQYAGPCMINERRMCACVCDD